MLEDYSLGCIETLVLLLHFRSNKSDRTKHNADFPQITMEQVKTRTLQMKSDSPFPELWGLKREQNPSHACFKFSKAKTALSCLPLLDVVVFQGLWSFPNTWLHWLHPLLRRMMFSLGLSGSSVAGYYLHVLVHSDCMGTNRMSHMDSWQKNIYRNKELKHILLCIRSANSSGICIWSNHFKATKSFMVILSLIQKRVVLISQVIKLRQIYGCNLCNFRSSDFYNCTCLDILN